MSDAWCSFTVTLTLFTVWGMETFVPDIQAPRVWLFAACTSTVFTIWKFIVRRMRRKDWWDYDDNF